MNVPASVAPRVWLLLCIAIACAGNLLWIERNAAPYHSWDDAEYLAQSVHTYQALERGDVIGFARLASRPARGVHPPMASLAPVPMYVLFGPGTKSALYANTVLIAIFAVYLFLLARHLLGNDQAAVVAVVVTFCFPLTYGLWRLLMAEFGLATATVAAQYHLLRCVDDTRGNTRHAILAGAFIGWGLLWKISLPAFVVGPFAYLLVRGIRRMDGSRARLIRTLAVIAATVLIVAGPFYLWRMDALREFAVYNTTPNPALEQFALGPPLSLWTVVRYWTALANFGTSAYFLLLGSGLAVLQLLRRDYYILRRPAAWFVVSCGIPPLLFFSFQYLKEPRHLFPAFAMIGIVIAALLNRVLHRKTPGVRRVVLGALLVVPAYQFVVLSFETDWAPVREVRLGALVLLPGERDSLFVRPANPTSWPVAEIVGLMAAHRENVQDGSPRVRVIGHIPFLDGPVLDYESLLRHGQPLVYSMLGDFSLSATWWDFLLVLSGPLGEPSEYREPLLATLLDEGRLPFAAVGKVALPGDRWATLYRKDTPGWRAGTSGENLVNATDRRGAALYPVARSEWALEGGRRTVLVPRDHGVADFDYVYVPPGAGALEWRAVRNAAATCDDAPYVVTVFDRNSRRGPAQTVSETRKVLPGQAYDRSSLDVRRFRGQIVTVRFSRPSSAGASESCIAWSEVSLVTDPVVRREVAEDANRQVPGTADTATPLSRTARVSK